MTSDAIPIYAIPTLRIFAFWYLVLVIKMVCTILAIGRARMATGALPAPEDYALRGLAPPPEAVPNERVERLRRVLLNDLENILPFFGVGVIYALCNPSLLLTRIYCAGFTVARIGHTVAYVRGLQPHRGIAFTIGLVIEGLMTLSALWTVL